MHASGLHKVQQCILHALFSCLIHCRPAPSGRFFYFRNAKLSFERAEWAVENGAMNEG